MGKSVSTRAKVFMITCLSHFHTMYVKNHVIQLRRQIAEKEKETCLTDGIQSLRLGFRALTSSAVTTEPAKYPRKENTFKPHGTLNSRFRHSNVIRMSLVSHSN